MISIEKNIIWIDSTTSTNEYLKKLVGNTKIESGTIISARTQTNGKGQHNNIWISEPYKNLTFSLFIEPKIKANKQFYISKIVALSVYSYLKNYTNKVKIKWPNDLYIENKKIGGILIENTIQGEIITKSIIGVGLNINQQNFGEELSNAVSLANICGKEFILEYVLTDIFSIIKNNFESEMPFNIIDKEFNSKLFRLNEISKFTDIRGLEFEGRIIGTEPEGTIKIETQTLVKIWVS